jgi:hypothetical protein
LLAFLLTLLWWHIVSQPSAILFVALCPKGSEGASYAMFTSAMNSAILLAPSISSMLLSIWDVRVETLQAGNLQGLFQLSILTAAIQMSPAFFLCWLPHSREELQQLASSSSSLLSKRTNGRLGGILFLFLLIASMSYVILVGVLNIVAPGWAGG